MYRLHSVQFFKVWNAVAVKIYSKEPFSTYMYKNILALQIMEILMQLAYYIV